VEEGSFRGMKAGKGSMKGVEFLGSARVPVEESDIVQMWTEKYMKETAGNVSEDSIFEAVKEEIRMKEPPPADVESVELEIFTGYVVNRLKNRAFVYKRPSSFP
jgi:hypothetical protein